MARASFTAAIAAIAYLTSPVISFAQSGGGGSGGGASAGGASAGGHRRMPARPARARRASAAFRPGRRMSAD